MTLSVEESKDKWMIRGEMMLFRLIIIFVATLFLSQLLLLREGTRIYLSKVDKMEGEQISAMPLYTDAPLKVLEETTVAKSYQDLFRKSKVISIQMIGYASELNVYMIVNGKRVATFNRGLSRIAVYDGDYVEIDATSLNQPARFIINAPDKDLLSPMDGLMVEGARSVLSIGKIKFKNE